MKCIWWNDVRFWEVINFSLFYYSWYHFAIRDRVMTFVTDEVYFWPFFCSERRPFQSLWSLYCSSSLHCILIQTKARSKSGRNGKVILRTTVFCILQKPMYISQLYSKTPVTFRKSRVMSNHSRAYFSLLKDGRHKKWLIQRIVFLASITKLSLISENFLFLFI